MDVHFLVLSNVVANGIEEYHAQKQLCLRGLHVGDEDLGSRTASVGAPVLWPCERQNTRPGR